MSPLVRAFVPVTANLSKKADINRKYEVCRKMKECVHALNKLQSNAQMLEKTRQTRDKLAPLHVPNMIKWASRVGISLDDIDRLKVIHVSGTKGKGSTCAYCESILRHQGFRTGFFSSPHLVEVRERFQVNGQPLTREKFVSYFWDVYNKLEATKVQNNDSMPAYFAFLTIMAIHVFQKEQTDVTILEVGIGGQYDSTNFVRKPVVCGVTSLGLDHVSILGNTIEKIAWQKAGIFKPGIPVFTSPQPPGALEVLHERAKEIGCKLELAPPFSSYQRPGEKFKLGIAGHMQKVNASLALQLTRVWMKSQGTLPDETVNGVTDSVISDEALNGFSDSVTNGSKNLDVAKCFPLLPAVIDGLVECKWLGRNQTIKKNKLTYYLDGAHTIESIQQCVEWFQKHSKREADSISGRVVKILLFNTTGDRDNTQLLAPLMKCGFDGAVFCPNIPYSASSSAGKNNQDLTNMTVTKETQVQKCIHNMDTWKRLVMSKRKMSGGNDVELKGENPSMNFTNNVDIKGDNSSVNLTNSSQDNATNGTEYVTANKVLKLAEDCNHSNISQDLLDSKELSCDIHSQSKQFIHSASPSEAQPGSRIKNTHSRQILSCDQFIENFSCIYDALLWASHGRDPNLKDVCTLPHQIQGADHIQVLVTGSIHLVGGTLGIVSDEYN